MLPKDQDDLTDSGRPAGLKYTGLFPNLMYSEHQS